MTALEMDSFLGFPGDQHEDQNLWLIFHTFVSDEDLMKECIDPKRLRNCLIEISKQYNDVPYHNKKHAESVMHGRETIFKACVEHISLPDMEFYHIALLLAAAMHDVDHDGSLCLEGHHVDVALNTMQKDGCDCTKNMMNDSKTRLEKTIKDLILSTSMDDHDNRILSFKRKEYEDFLVDGLSNSDFSEKTSLLMSMILKCADLWHVVLPWPNHKVWTEKYLLEQGEDVTQAAVQDQLWFLQVRCRPCFGALSRIFPSCRAFSRNLESNVSIWRTAITN